MCENSRYGMLTLAVGMCCVGFMKHVGAVVDIQRQTSYTYSAQLSRFHLKTDRIQPPKRRVLNKTVRFIMYIIVITILIYHRHNGMELIYINIPSSQTFRSYLY
jgi:hypothetical protein